MMDSQCTDHYSCFRITHHTRLMLSLSSRRCCVLASGTMNALSKLPAVCRLVGRTEALLANATLTGVTGAATDRAHGLMTAGGATDGTQMQQSGGADGQREMLLAVWLTWTSARSLSH